MNKDLKHELDIILSGLKKWYPKENEIYEASVSFIDDGTDFIFHSLEELIVFYYRQIDGWRNKNVKVEFLKRSEHYFRRFSVLAVKLDRDYVENVIENGGLFKKLIEDINETYTGKIKDVFTYNSKRTKLIESLYSSSAEKGLGAYKCFTGGNVSVNSINMLEGYFLAVLLSKDVIGQDENDITSSADREQLQSLLEEYREKFDEFEHSFSQASKQLETGLSNINDSLKDLEGINQKRIEAIVGDYNKRLDELFTESEKRINETQEAFREYSSFSAPKDLWDTRARELNDKGDKFFRWAVGFGVIGIIMIILLLIFPSETLVETIFSDLAIGIKWSAMFIVLFSLYAYGLRSIVKMMFSQYHLARDAEERAALTGYYLSLKNENAASNTEMNLIIQSLFSRSDTGLLKDDGGVTMPSDFIKKSSMQQ